MTPYPLLPIRGALAVALPVALFVWRHNAARPADHLCCAPSLVIYFYGLAASCVNRVWVRVTEEGVACRVGPMPCGSRPSWMPRAEVRAVYARRIRVKSGYRRAAGVERRDGLCLDLSDPYASDEEVEHAAAEITQALRWTEPVLREDEGELVLHEKKSTAPVGLWLALLVAAVAWSAR